MHAVTKLKCSHEVKFYDLTGFLGNLLTVSIEKLYHLTFMVKIMVKRLL